MGYDLVKSLENDIRNLRADLQAAKADRDNAIAKAVLAEREAIAEYLDRNLMTPRRYAAEIRAGQRWTRV